MSADQAEFAPQRGGNRDGTTAQSTISFSKLKTISAKRSSHLDKPKQGFVGKPVKPSPLFRNSISTHRE
jgi:hypothetical protein